MNKLTAILVAVAIFGGLVYSSVFVVNEREQVIVTRFGAVRELVNEPGIYFKVPTTVMEDLIRVDDRLLRFDLDDITVQVKGGKFYKVDAFMIYHIEDLQKFLQTVSADLKTAEDRLGKRLEAVLRAVYGLRGFQAALSVERQAMMQEVYDKIKPDVESLGVRIVDVRIRRTDLTNEVSTQTYARMQAERKAIAADLRAKGNQEAQRIRAVADRKAIETVATAEKESEILRGEGDAERIRIFAEAFSRDPQFFEFYRSMKAYETALTDSDSMMVLSTDSEFFRFFQQSIRQERDPALNE